VKWQKSKRDVKSIGNSATLPKDVTDREEVKRWIYALAESVTGRQRLADVGRANTVHLVVRNEQLQFFNYQTKIPPTSICGDVAKTAFELFCKQYPKGAKVRLLGITLSGFDYHIEQMQLDVAGERAMYEKKERAENAVAKIREKYGYSKLQRGVVFADEELNGWDIKSEKDE
jgi:DNA polymerase-4